MRRQRYFLAFTLASLLRRKVRHASLFIVYTLVVFMLASVLFFTHAMQEEADAILQNAPSIIVQRSLAGRPDLIPTTYLERIKKIRGVSSARGRLWSYYYDPAGKASYTIVVPEKYQHAAGTAAVGIGLAATAFVSPDGGIELTAFDGSIVHLKVQEHLWPASQLASSDLILIGEADFRRLFGIFDDHATDLAVEVRNDRETDTVAFKIADMFPDTRIVLREEFSRTYDSIFNRRGGMLVFLLAGPVLAFLVFAWDRASGLSREEKREIGVLKAIGWETSDVLQMKAWQGLTISLSALLTGTALAWGYVFFSDAILLQGALKGWSILYPAFKPAPSMEASQVFTLFFLIVIPYTMATIIPSWTAATIDPDTAMRV